MAPQIQQKEAAMAAGFANVAEAWPIYDTLILSSTFYGQEASVQGWFASFVAFSQQERHSFFKSRTEANASLAYCNKQTADSMDFASEVYSIGCAFFAPGVRVLMADTNPSPNYQTINTQIAHWWECELPRHCSVELKVQQDTILEVPAMACSPGYGPVGGGASFDHPAVGRIESQGTGQADYHPVMNMSVTQGVPDIKNRWPFPLPIQIPRTATIEIIVTVSEYARDYLSRLTALNPQYVFGGIDGVSPDPTVPPYTIFPARFGIQVSLLGKRLVQQRAQYHR